MFDIGIGEIMILAVLGLLIFGPERLPKAAADAGRLARQLREMASGAKRDLADSAGLDMSEAMESVRSIGDLHPRKLAAGLFTDDEPADAKPAKTESDSSPATRPVFDPDAT
ncbi:MAG: twin-arginine translocase TatA/TatE family subunit [Actinomycetota bacterium]|nr:twin-arginine translocase TatA/TatE family subunit [Actinomycetota bacterium]